MPGLNSSQSPTFYRVRIMDGHSASGLLVSAMGKRCIPSTQYWLTVDVCTAYRDKFERFDGANVVMPARPEERVPVDLDIRVWGMAANGRGFSQRARTQNISASGARLCQIEHDLKIGDIIGVQAGEKKTRCKVVWARETRSIQKIEVGVLSKTSSPWFE
jgi:hypothetical protein